MKTLLLLLLFSTTILAQLQVSEKFEKRERINNFYEYKKQLHNDEESFLHLRNIEKREKIRKLYEQHKKDTFNPVEVQNSVSEGNLLAVPQAEKDALIALYNSAGGANWTDNTNWLSGEPVGNWFGITVENEHVTEIQMDDNNLSGSLPPEIGNLSSLEILSLSRCQQLTGNIPPQIGNLTSLDVLNLTNNQLTGTIPVEIGNLTSLYWLSFYSNQLTGNIPPQIGNLTNLLYLLLDVNQLTGTIPVEIGNLTSLYWMIFSDNQLTGTIPAEIENLTSLHWLDLGSNQLTGTIPVEIGNLPSLEGLELWGNQLTGTIPSQIGNINLLKYLLLNNNELSGSVPTQISDIDSLLWLHLDINSFSDLPNLSSLTNLRGLYIDQNKFTFEDIIPNINVASDSLDYAPQDSVGTLQNTNLAEGDELNTSVTVGGSGNKYQWKKNGVVISGATNSSYTISSVLSSDEGSYVCEVTNPSAPDLTLYSRPVNLTVGTVIIVFAPTVSNLLATNTTSNSATLNGKINPNGSTTTYIFEYGKTTSYGNIISTAEEITGTSDINVTANITDLASNTLYHYRITATNSSGTTISSDATFTTTSETSGADLLWQTLIVSSFNWQVGSTITAELNILNNGLATAGAHQSQLYLSVDKTINTQDTPLGNPISYLALSAGGSLTLSETFSVPVISNGIYYIGAIVDINNDVAESNESNNNYFRTGKIILGQPESITLSNAVSFGSSSESSSYRMLGIPGDNNIPISQTLTGSNEDDWVAYYDNGNSSDYLIKYDGTSIFNFKPGKGFWVLANSNFTINRSVNSVELQSELMPNSSYEIVYPIPVHDGWNIISNPFETSVIWNNVKLINSVSEDIHYFNGSFSSASSFQPYNGYYFYNASNINSLYIPYLVNDNISDILSKVTDQADEIILSLLHDNITKSTITIGFNDDAKNTYDTYDRFAPPGDFDEFRLSFYNENLETPYKYLLTDFRPLSNEGEIYTVNLKAKLNEKIKIEFSIPDNFQNSEVYLVDQNFNLMNMKTTKSIEFIPTRSLYELKILIGSQDYINNEKTNFLPKEFSLNQNYPNPFNPTTNISFTIPKTEFVTLDIYNAIGQKITSLVNKKLNPGIYTEQWNAINYSSGIYYAKLSAGNNVVTQKLVLMK